MAANIVLNSKTKASSRDTCGGSPEVENLKLVLLSKLQN